MSPLTILRTRHLAAVGLAALVLVGVSAAQDDPTKDIKEVEKKIEELKAKLAALKAPAPAKTAQQPLTLKDAVSWPGISRTALSRDGQWFAAAYGKGEGKGELVVRQTAGDKETRYPADMLAGIAFSHDSKWLAFSTIPRVRPGAAAPATPPAPEASKVVLVNLAKGDKVEYEGITRFAFAGESGDYLALHKPAPAAPAAAPTTLPANLPAALRARMGEAAQPARVRGSDLILRELATGKDLTLGNVAEFGFDKKGTQLAMLIDAQGQTGNGVQLRDMKTGTLRQLDSGKATYQSLAWTEKGEAFSLLKGVEDKGLKDKRFSVLAYKLTAGTGPTPIAYDPATDSAFPKDMVITAGRTPTFSDDLTTVFFGIQVAKKADAPMMAKGADKKLDPSKGPALAKGDTEKPDLVIWHGGESRLQAQQQVEAGMDQAYNYLCAVRLEGTKFLRLADDSLKQVQVLPKQRYALGMDPKPYERSGSLDGKRFMDVYFIDLQTGQKTLALKQARNVLGTSPDGTKLAYFEDGQVHVYFFSQKASACVSKAAPVSFVNTEDDHNIDRPPTRLIGWASDSNALLMSDNWDVWKLPLDKDAPVNLTVNGKKDGIRYRGRIPLDVEEKGVDLTKPQYFSTYGEWTKKSGFVRIDPSQQPAVLAWDDAAYGVLMKARDADVFVHTRETPKDYPDYYATDATFKSPRRLTNAVPDQGKYAWSAGSMLVDYESAKGGRLQANLILPANYEKGKKYPTVVYIYEKLSQGKNQYLTPRVGGGFNASIYTSNGYAVLMPDISYKINDPGMSAVWCVLPALDAAIATGVVDGDKVGLQGHSWGGYQTAFLITQTPRFKAAVAGAPLTNLVSMYSSIYWNTGWANQPIFESSQGRFTGGYLEQPEAYLRNSPVFHAQKVQTPLILLHNDKDGAVDFNQGVEYFNTLRRLDKPVVMLQYKGENHGLVKPANQKDYAARMREFFDHHLMGKAAPAWLKDGVPHLKMEEHLKERADGL